MPRFNLFYFASPASFYPVAGKLAWFFGVLAIVFGGIGLYYAFVMTPAEVMDHGPTYKASFVHVPAAWMSMFIYVVMAGWAALGMIYNTRLSSMMALALAPTGALFTFVALITGAIWGKPTWGTWWVWDARLTSELFLFFLYIGFLALNSAIEDPRRAARASGIIALVGVVNIPIIWYSVEWWNSLHQTASVMSSSTKGKTDPNILLGWMWMAFCFWSYTISAALTRVRGIILEREQKSEWVESVVGGRA